MRFQACRLHITFQLLSALILLTPVNALAAGDQSAELGERLSFFRWLEDYSTVTEDALSAHSLAPLKRLALSEASYPYLTLGGDYRLRYEHDSNQFFGLRGEFSTDSALHRFMLHSDLQFESARVFIQLADFEEQGRRGGPRPLDESDLDVQQAFVDWKSGWGLFRLGRQEISLGAGKKTGIREGPNQRRAFDAARVTLDMVGRGPLDIIYAREVQPNSSAFEDESTKGPKLLGLYANAFAHWNDVVNLDLFYLGIERDSGVYNQGVGQEKRHSLGARVWKRTGSVHFDYEATYQFGDFASGDISAWGLATETSFVFDSHKWKPRIGSRMNFASGDSDPNDDDLGTYSALFPNPTYVSESAIFTPGNGFDIQPFVQVHPHSTLTLFLGVDFHWRMTRGDALYANPGVPLIRNDVSDARFNAYLVSFVATWTPSPYVTVQGVYVHNDAGDFVRDAGGSDTEFFMFSVAARF